ncbi:MAG: hypothetical protein ABI165_07920 [Bryobacteraceae bacterium]
MKALGLLLRLFSYLYQLVLAVLLLGIATAAGGGELQLAMLTGMGASANRWAVAIGIAGLVITILAIAGILRFLFPAWCLIVLALMIHGYYLSAYTFNGPEEWRSAGWITAGALLAFLGSLTVFRTRRKR